MLKELLQKNSSTLFSLLLLVLIPVLVSSTLAFFLFQYQDVLADLAFWQILVYFAVVSLTMAFALTPTTFIALVTGFYLGWPGFIGVVVSYGIAAMLGYRTAQLIDHGKMMHFLNRFEKIAAVMTELREQSWSLIFLSRISPVLPFAFMTFVLSLMRVNKKKFLLASMVGMLPRTLFFFWLGTQAQSIITLINNPDAGNQGKILVGALVLLSAFGLYYVFNRALKRALARTSSAKN